MGEGVEALEMILVKAIEMMYLMEVIAVSLPARWPCPRLYDGCEVWHRELVLAIGGVVLPRHPALLR